MKTWIKRTLIGLFGASVLFGGLAACSHHRFEHARGPMTEADAAKLRERVIDKVTRELALDEAQKAKLGAVADALKAQRAALLAGTQFDRAKAQALLEAKTGAVRDKSPAVVTALADFYDSLKPEQQQKVREVMARGRRFGWHG